MPLPPPTFTKSKWLAFFAEITAKITHHSVTVVIEGLELIRRLLISRISVGAILEEGNLLQHLLDTAIGAVKCERAPTQLDAEMLCTLFQCLSLLVDMMASMFADGDPYYALLVLSRAGVILEAFSQILQGKNRNHFGETCLMIQILISLPITKPTRPLAVEGLSLIRHVKSLEESVTRNTFYVQQLFDAAGMLAVGSAGTVIGFCSRKLAAQLHDILALQEPASLAGAEAASPPQLESIVIAAYSRIAVARCHEDCLDAINELWCCYAIDSQLTSVLSDKGKVRPALRFLQTAPSCSADAVVFRSILGWFAELVTKQPIPTDAREALLGTVPSSLIPMLLAAPSDDDARLEKPSPTAAIVTFLQRLELSCHSAHIASWISTGLLGYLEKCVREASAVTSVLVDAPSTVDGTLPDEIYLSCALKSCRSQTSTRAIAAMKLLSCLLEHHGPELVHDFSAELLALILSVVPVTVKIVINNPTMQASSQATPSLLHHVPRCHRACRPTTIGECAAVLLASCLALDTEIPNEIVTYVLSALPALQRAVKDSVVPHLRTVVSRVAVRVCTSGVHLVAAIREMPSLIPTAVVTLLNYSPESPQWEAAGAAELLYHILGLIADDRTLDESVQIGQSALPVQLLKIAASHPISGATAAIAQLIPAVAEQQSRLKLYGLNSQCVLAPMGTKSIPCWIALLQKIQSANAALPEVFSKLEPMKTVTKDAFERATTSFEEISIQFSFCSAVFRGLKFLFSAYSDFRDAFDPSLINEALTSAFGIPSPPQLAIAVGQKFCIDVSHSKLLQRTYEEMVIWAAECAASWFHPSITLNLPGMSPAFFAGCTRIMSSEGISHISRTAVAAALNAMMLLPHQLQLIESFEPSSREVFDAMLHVHNVPIVQAARSRLVSMFFGANRAAYSSGWLSQNIRELHELCCTLRVAKRLDSSETEKLAIVLSLVTAVLSSDAAQSLDSNDLSLLSSALLVFSCFTATRKLVLKSWRALAFSEQGRHLLMTEAPGTENQGKSCFTRLLQLTFLSQSGQKNDKESLQGLEAVSVAVAKGRDVLAQPLIKLKIIDAIDAHLNALDRQRALGPVELYRFLASATLSGEIQVQVARHPDLLTLLVEAAASQTEIGTLCLLCVRNCCFNHGCKWQLCQDSRVLQLLRSAMLLVPTTLSSSSAMQYASQQKVLATSALWALAYNNQRGKSCIRGLLRQPMPNSKPLSLKELSVNVSQQLSAASESRNDSLGDASGNTVSLDAAFAANLEGLIRIGL